MPNSRYIKGLLSLFKCYVIHLENESIISYFAQKKYEKYSTGVPEPWDIGCGRKSAFNKSGIKRSKAWKYMRYNTQKIKKRFQCKKKSNINPNCYNSWYRSKIRYFAVFYLVLLFGQYQVKIFPIQVNFSLFFIVF